LITGTELFNTADQSPFKQIFNDKLHVVQALLAEKASIKYSVHSHTL